MKLKCIIIDDDLHSINGLKSYISSLASLELIQYYTDPVLALNEISAGLAVDIIFMDVDMPLISGLELSKSIRHKTDKLIFTTSHSKYAYEAFEIYANAYLLKPYTFARFAETINKLFPQVPSSQQVNIKHTDDYFFVRNKSDHNNLIKVRYSDIVAVESLQNYVRIFTLNETIVSYIALSEIKIILLEFPNFAQAHRSFIIAKNYIEKVEGHTLKMINNLTINIGNSYRDNIQDYIKEKTIKTSRS
ncbi:LytR/AlgR family response regulator transcription factor [Pedobacter sp. GSP4]|uniref:LytR/AlgR family response regulator transcription factor n=1 Tax=Pedobacter sp. GSP4 TaxID=3453716 RepID=UPI003EED7BFC